MHEEEALSGGHAGGAVVRVDETVRKAWHVSTPSVHAFMAAVRGAGVDVPEVLGRDAAGRQVLAFVPGRLAIEVGLSRPKLRRAGALVRAIHDAGAAHRPADDAVWSTAIPSPGDELVCHNDLAPWNLIVGDRWVFIDWDAAAPSTRLWDLAYAAQAFTLSDIVRDPAEAGADLAAFVDGYGAEAAMRTSLPDALGDRAAAMLHLLETSAASGVEPWASMHDDFHGPHWRAATDYARRHRDVWAASLAS